MELLAATTENSCGLQFFSRLLESWGHSTFVSDGSPHNGHSLGPTLKELGNPSALFTGNFYSSYYD